MGNEKNNDPSATLLAAELLEEQQEEFFSPGKPEDDGEEFGFASKPEDDDEEFRLAGKPEDDDEEFRLAGKPEGDDEEFCLAGKTHDHDDEFCLAGALEKKSGDEEIHSMGVADSSPAAESLRPVPEKQPEPLGVRDGSASIRAAIANKSTRHLRLALSAFLVLTALVFAGVGWGQWPHRGSVPLSPTLPARSNEPLGSQFGAGAQPQLFDWESMEDFREKLGATSKKIDALKNLAPIEELTAFRVDFPRLISEKDSQEGAEGLESGLTAGAGTAQLEENASFLAAVNDPPIRLEKERPAAAGSSKRAAGASEASPIRVSGSEDQPPLLAPSSPKRALIAACESEGNAVIARLGALRMAAHEGADGRRWIRVIGPNWRRDLAAGGRLPLGNPGEARVWVDEEGVFGVVKVAGQAPCRVMWDSRGSN